MRIVTSIQLELYGETKLYAVSAKQGDRATRFVEVELMMYGTQFEIPADATVYANIRKPDKRFCFNECEVVDNHVMVELTNQALAAAGRALCDVEIRRDADMEILTSASFAIEIEETQRDENALISSNEMSALDKRVQAYIDALLAVQETASTAALAANTSAGAADAAASGALGAKAGAEEATENALAAAETANEAAGGASDAATGANAAKEDALAAAGAANTAAENADEAAAGADEAAERANNAAALAESAAQEAAVVQHNAAPDAHADIRQAVQNAATTAEAAATTAEGAQSAAEAAADAAEAAQETANGKAPMYTYGTTDLTAGSSALETGKLYFVYE